jgi:hypothetical protein
MWSKVRAGVHVNRSRAVGCFVLCVAALAAGDRLTAQSQSTVIQMKGALQTYAPDHIARTVVSELGTGRSRVVIEVRNRRNEVVATANGELSPRTPLVLDFRVPNTELMLLSTTVKITTTTPGTSVPAAVLEEIGPDQLTMKPRISCSGPSSGRDSAQTMFFCPGWSVTTFVLGGV